MAESPGIGCILFADDDQEARIARQCKSAAVIETGSDDYAAVLVCHLGQGHDGDHHDTLDGLWWRADEGRDDA